MSQSDCIFCKIIDGKIPADLRYEDEAVIAFNDIHPKADTHILLVPRRHVEHLGTAATEDIEAIRAILPSIASMVRELNIASFKLVINNGAAVGQSVPHLHVHLLGGQIQPGGLQSL